MSNLYRGPSIDASYQGSVHLANGFRGENFKKLAHHKQDTRFYFTKTKQSGYYLNLFHESNLLSYLCWLTHLGLNVSAPTFKSCDQYIFETDARNRESVCGLPEWSTVMRTDVLYKDC
jgi:hypothetical protein